MEAAYEHSILGSNDIRDRLTDFYTGALAVYLGGEQAKGCMIMSTAVSTATFHRAIQRDLMKLITSLDDKFTEQFQQAIDAQEISSSISAENRAMVAQSLLHSMSIRARAGDNQSRLTRLLESVVEMITS